MITSIYKKGAKHLFYWWLQKDLNHYLTMIETMTLKSTVESNQNTDDLSAFEENSDALSWLLGLKQDVWNYSTFLVINMYKVGNYTNPQRTVEEEAEKVVQAMVDRFLLSLGEKKEFSLRKFFPTPDYKLTAPTDLEEEFASSTLAEELDPSLFELLAVIKKEKDIETIIELVKQEKSIEETVRHVKAKYSPGKQKWSFKPKGKHYLVLLWHLLYQACHDIRHFSSKYNITFLYDGEVRCLYNVLNLYIHFIALHGKAKLTLLEREAIFAASALHPLQDDYIDEIGPSEEMIISIEKKVKGEEVPFLNEKAQVIFDLIDVIYTLFPVKEHPTLVTIFSKLHEYQLLSMQQKKDSISEEELLRISFLKGGYAFAFFGYIAHGKMSIPSFNHFFIMGAIFQICDDFHDIEDDLASGSTTIWTKAIKRKETLDCVMNATIAIQDYYEESTGLVEDFKHPVLLRRIELFGIRYDLFRFFTMNYTYFSDDYVNDFESCFPFPVHTPKNVFQSTRPYETLDTFITILEEGKRLFLSRG